MPVSPHFCNHGVQPFNPIEYHVVMYSPFAANLSDADPFHFRSCLFKSSSQALSEILHIFLCLLSVFWTFLWTVGECNPIIFFRHKVPLDQSSIFFYSVSLVILSHLLWCWLLSLFSFFSRSTIPSGMPHLNLPAIIKFPYYPLVHCHPVPNSNMLNQAI